MHIEVLEDGIDIGAILEEANNIKLALKTGWSRVHQIGLQAIEPNVNPRTEYKKSIGRLKNLDYPETYFKYTMWDTPVINRYIQKYGMFRTRIMISKAKSCLTRHADLSKRIHIPLFTNEDCFMVIDDRTYYLEPGKIYLTNTTKKHTAVNASQKIRGHIVGCVYE